ncbi:MAG: 2-polyprenyl-6-methoxyphenol hydroxylase-like FAD-dependent oxidoreductase, partial [Bacteroidia bacterium]
MTDSNEPYNVVICGGGLAGLTLSLQLKQQNPALYITVIEKTERPLKEAAHKVGESTVEIGAHYLSQKLGLKSYIDKKQFPKL